MSSDDKILALTRDVLTPAFTEVAASPALNRRFTARTVEGPWCEDPTIAAMITILRAGNEESDSLVWGATLVIEERDPAKRVGFAGRFLLSPLFRKPKRAGLAGLLSPLFGRSDGEVYVSPVVLYHMKFDGKTHKFMHRYDKEVENHRVEDVTRAQVLNHLLDSFDFYKMTAFSTERPW